MTNIATLYTARATATGGRNGQVKTDDGVLNLEVRMPKALGGSSDTYTNPEQLFAAGYAACFDSALNLVIRTQQIKTGTTAVTAEVSLGKTPEGGFGLAVKLEVSIPDIDRQQALELVEKAHQVCPYSNATRGNIPVELTVL
ncbi:organic hydroperoxide resistance protein [Chitinophaga nivalis]|uniref:Organic hydroperoxide resistance protein n=1 Tax=Chitinophaga nivalis TaxID=2991709 RepID=A0ABT3ILH1_9BACT|nr:organic hydroperoxide resistance protein [Chitinophaga nivalis]MCW3465497.1 organic hydroperoxide resistance protein [Chitinophaga nivalis]MCW3484812.1 organic hydroperoxide resistance protein [Chitinophaga nivalis]